MDLKAKIALLAALQDKDSVLDGIRRKAAHIPEQIAAVRHGFEEYRAAHESRKKELQQFQLARKEKELEAEAKDAAIRKHGAELGAVKTNDAYRALVSEIEAGKKEKFSLENEILDIMERIEQESVKIKDAEKLLKEKEAETGVLVNGLESEGRALQDEIARMEQERAQFVAQIPDDIMHRYDYIRESKNGVAIAPIDGMNCGGCHMELRPQTINEARKGQDWIICDSCSRILFVK